MSLYWARVMTASKASHNQLHGPHVTTLTSLFEWTRIISY
jgi:hypothetical protein